MVGRVERVMRGHYRVGYKVGLFTLKIWLFTPKNKSSFSIPGETISISVVHDNPEKEIQMGWHFKKIKIRCV